MKKSLNAAKESSEKIFRSTMDKLELTNYKIIDEFSGGINVSGNFTDEFMRKIARSNKLQRVASNPVHIIDEEGDLSPTALIPFCEFNGNMTVMGIKKDQFKVPFCNSFRPKIIKNQLFYELDPNNCKDEIDMRDRISLSFFIAYNEERQLEHRNTSEEDYITMNTIGGKI